MTVLAKFQYFGRSAGQGLLHAPFVHFVAVITLAIALFTLGLARGTSLLLAELIDRLGGEVQMTAYLKPGLGETEAQRVVDSLPSGGGMKVRIVTRAMALERLVAELGEQGRALQVGGGADAENPLPTSLELTVPPRARDASALRRLAAALRGRAEVDEVDYGEEAVARLGALARALRLGGLSLLVIVMIATIVIVSATLQLAIYARREEVEIQKLVGATNRFVKAPFLIEGMFQGVLGGGAALAALWAFFTFVGPRLVTLLAFLQVEGVRSPFTPMLAAEVMGVGILLGLFGSFIAVGRFLKV